MTRNLRWTAAIGPTAAIVRDVMIEGESGVMNVPRVRKYDRPIYQPSKARLLWPNGARTQLYSAEKPDRIRGGQFQWVWLEELASWSRQQEAWDQVMFVSRLRGFSGVLVTSTPKPTPVIRALYKDPDATITRGSSYDNRANLDDSWYSRFLARYEGTRLGRQEIHGELLLDVPGASFTWDSWLRVARPLRPSLSRVVIGLDPAGSDGEDSNEMGIVVDGKGFDGFGYVLADRSFRGTPGEVAERVVNTFDEFDADLVVVEANHGGDWIPAFLRTRRRDLPIRVVHASRGKTTRAEPIAAQYEQGKWRHCAPPENEVPTTRTLTPLDPLAELEEQMTSWVPDSGMTSPDRMDAHVWAATELRITGDVTVRPPRERVTVSSDPRARRPMAGVKRKKW